jgi:catechol 1,2-dioxygenase
MHGHVLDFNTQIPVSNATIDVWQASTNGLYEQQDKNQKEYNLRGKFRTDENGRYRFYCLRPTPYPVPNDGLSGPCNLSTGKIANLQQVLQESFSSFWIGIL